LEIKSQSFSETSAVFDFSKIGLFIVLLIVGLLGLIVQSNFQSQKISVSWLVICFLGLCLNGMGKFYFPQSQSLRLLTAILSTTLISFLFLQLQSSQSLFLILILLHILIIGLQDGTQSATQLSLFSSATFSGVIILSQNFSHFQDLLSLGLFNLSAFVTAALSGLYAEKLLTAEKVIEQSQDLLQDLSSRHRVLIDELPLGLLVFSESGELVEKNQFFDSHFSGLKEASTYFVLEKSHKTLKIEKLGQVLYQSLHFQEIISGKKTYHMVLIEDVTKTVFLQEDLKQKEKMAAIGTLAAGIAHEIRNPLAGMSGSVELLSMNPNTEEDKKLFRIILREIDRLNRLITEFLDYSKPNVVETEPMSLKSVVLGVLQILETTPEKPTNLQIDVKLSEDHQILGSPDKLKQAFLNIMINSLQAMKGINQPLLTLELKKASAPGFVELLIKDNGSGMTAQTKTKMFEPFHTTKSKGTGLGLAITHKILQGHQAQVVVESEVGRGCQFQLIFPCLEPHLKTE